VVYNSSDFSETTLVNSYNMTTFPYIAGVRNKLNPFSMKSI
jgi:hypothetical protein